MKPPVLQAAAILGIELRVLREYDIQSAHLGPLPTMVFAAKGARIMNFTLGREGSSVILSDEHDTQRSIFSLKGQAPVVPEELVAYLRQEPRLIDALHGGPLPSTPFDWQDYG